MAKRIKDTDYLPVSGRIRAMENSLLTKSRMEQLLEARTEEELEKVLQECGYPELDAQRPEAMDAAIAKVRERDLADASAGVPDTRYIDIFKVKYDYHNIKTALKAQAMGTDPIHMMIDMGRVSAEAVKKAVLENDLENLPPRLQATIAEGREILETTRDPQLSDMAVDRRMYEDLTELAQKTRSSFLQGYVRAQIDAANLRTVVRVIRMGKGGDFLKNALLPGGDFPPEQLEKVGGEGSAGLAEVYVNTDFQSAAEAGQEALQGGSLTNFERLCDDAVGTYLSGAQRIPFGEAPLLGYLAARETEYTNLRILLMGRSAGLSADVIRSRLRAGYV